MKIGVIGTGNIGGTMNRSNSKPLKRCLFTASKLSDTRSAIARTSAGTHA